MLDPKLELIFVESFAPYWRGSRTSEFGPHFGSRKQVKNEPKMGPIFPNLFLREMVVIRVYGALVDTTLHDESSRIFLERSGSLGNECKFGNRPLWAPISSRYIRAGVRFHASAHLTDNWVRHLFLCWACDPTQLTAWLPHNTVKA